MNYSVLIVYVVAYFLQLVFCQQSDCNFFQHINPLQTYYTYSPRYPNKYPSGVNCRWIMETSTDYQIKISCELELPTSSKCADDKLIVSKSGDPTLAGGETYCGKGTLSLTSTSNKMAIGLLSKKAGLISNLLTGLLQGGEGRFICTTSAISVLPTTCNCGKKRKNENQVQNSTGRTETLVNEFPSMVGIADLSTYSIVCGGTIIDKRYIVTAAHCLDGKQLSSMGVIVGEHDVNDNESPATKAYRVASYIIHPLYSHSDYKNDIGIIRTSTDIVFGDRVNSVCLPFKFTRNSFVGQYVDVVGWTKNQIGDQSSKLMKVKVDVIPNSNCSAAHSVDINDNQLCTDTSGKDNCTGHTGGPLYYTDPSTSLLFLVGIPSYGTFCGFDKPSVNTRITPYLEWIIQNTPKASYCHK